MNNSLIKTANILSLCLTFDKTLILELPAAYPLRYYSQVNLNLIERRVHSLTLETQSGKFNGYKITLINRITDADQKGSSDFMVTKSKLKTTKVS